MSGLGLAETAALAGSALEGGAEATLAVVVEAPAASLVGRRLAWDGTRLRGTLGEAGLDAAAAGLLARAGDPPGCHALEELQLYVERVAPPPELVIVGAGHIAQPLARVGTLLGHRVTVLDDRPEYARRERFPDADRVRVADFDDPFAGVAVGPRTRIVLVTRGHRYDYQCVVALARAGAEPAYLGMIGSRRRVRAALERLSEDGVPVEWLERIHAPVGLDVGAETPAEIAVAIAAEMILRARGGSGQPLDARHDLVRFIRGRIVGVAGESR